MAENQNPDNFETAQRASGKITIALGELSVNLEIWRGSRERDDDEYVKGVKAVCPACMS